MKRIKVKSITLYRGTDGRTGKKISKLIAKEGPAKAKWVMEDAPLAGYTDDVGIAHDYGVGVDGISVRMKVAKEEIVVHKDLFSGITGELGEEAEYIILGGKRSIPLRDISYNPFERKF